MNKIKQLFTNKKFKYGTNATIFTIAFIAVVIVINLILGTLADKFSIKLDLTKNKIYNLTAQTKDIIKSLNQDVKIYVISKEGSEPVLLKEVVQRYDNLSNKISAETVDINKNPTFANKYVRPGESIGYNSLIFVSGNKSKIVNAEDLFTQNIETGKQDAFAAEQRFTSAIKYVTSGADTKAMLTEGHGENAVNTAQSLMTRENIITSKINLLTTEIPNDVELLIIVSPKKDFSQEEIERLDNFFDRGGNAQIYFDINNISLPNLENYLKEWGILVRKDFVVEKDKAHILNSYLNIIPTIQSSTITESLIKNDFRVIVPNTRSIEILPPPSGIKVTPLLTTTENSYSRTDMKLTTIEKTESDLKGPLNIMALIERPSQNSNKTAKLVVVGTSIIIQDEVIGNTAFGNEDLLLNSIAYMQDKKEAISISPKSLTSPALKLDLLKVAIISILIVIIIPLTVFIIGFVVWLRRRHL